MPIGVGSIGGIGATIVLVVGLFLGVDPSTLLALLITDQAQPRPVDVAHRDRRMRATTGPGNSWPWSSEQRQDL
jgi:hypothetical protein